MKRQADALSKESLESTSFQIKWGYPGQSRPAPDTFGIGLGWQIIARPV
jgi:hypothetical protein